MKSNGFLSIPNMYTRMYPEPGLVYCVWYVFKLFFVNLNDGIVNVFVKRSFVHVLYGMYLIEPTYKMIKLGL